jgi:hypothetical protein
MPPCNAVEIFEEYGNLIEISLPPSAIAESGDRLPKIIQLSSCSNLLLLYENGVVNSRKDVGFKRERQARRAVTKTEKGHRRL